MKVKRVLLYTLIFLTAFTVSLYFTFPFERVIKRVLFEKGLYPSEVSFRHFPPELFVGELPLKGITLRKLTVKPVSLHRFKIESELCGGRLWATSGWPPGRISFSLKEVRLSECPFRFQQIEAEGRADGKGYLDFSGKHLTGGKGEFTLSGVKVKNLNFGLFSFKELRMGEGRITYSVTSKDYVKINGNLKGKDAEVAVKGSVSYNPQNPENSYVNFQFAVEMKSGKLTGQRFNFTVRGNFNSLRFY